MCIIKIPKSKNKLDFVYSILYELKRTLKDYKLINCTESPIEEFNYIKIDNVYCRYIEEIIDKNSIDKAKYVAEYTMNNLNKQGYSLDEYIEFCLLFELDEVNIVAKTHNQNLVEHITNSKLFAKLLICHDGLNEVHIVSKESSRIIEVLEDFAIKSDVK